jgi:hypothetical protein
MAYDRDPEPYEGPDYQCIRESHPKARQEHRCMACPDPIQVGEVHEYHLYKEDGHLKIWRAHIYCPRDRAADEAYEAREREIQEALA